MHEDNVGFRDGSELAAISEELGLFWDMSLWDSNFLEGSGYIFLEET